MLIVFYLKVNRRRPVDGNASRTGDELFEEGCPKRHEKQAQQPEVKDLKKCVYGIFGNYTFSPRK